MATIQTRRVDNANFWAAQPAAAQTPNGDEALYPDLRASFGKGLPHNALAEPDTIQFAALVNAMTTGTQASFDAIILSNVATGFGDGQPRRLANPQNGLGLNLIGSDPRHRAMQAAPAFASREIAGEIAENYWMALLRDVHFSDYTDAHHMVREACRDLTAFGADFKGPKDGGGKVTPNTLFRGIALGDTSGPWISQFLLQDCYFGAQPIDQRMRTVVAGLDYMNNFGQYLHVQKGYNSPGNRFDNTPCYMRNGRDIGQWVHVDQLAQAYFLATMILTRSGGATDNGNPYKGFAGTPNEYAFGTFGGPHIPSLMMEVATRALKAVWFQKWGVHRRLRPEVFACRVHQQKTGVKDYGIHSAIMQDSSAPEAVYAKYGSYMLPMAFPEGSPTHPAYGAGHATVAGACVTILKAWFDGAQKIVDLTHPLTGKPLKPVVASPDGLSLIDYIGSDSGSLTVGGELNKLAFNIGNGRNIAGVHWRSDYTESVKLGEQVAIDTLRDYCGTYNEAFQQFFLQKFDGSFVKITCSGEEPQ